MAMGWGVKLLKLLQGQGQEFLAQAFLFTIPLEAFCLLRETIVMKNIPKNLNLPDPLANLVLGFGELSIARSLNRQISIPGFQCAVMNIEGWLKELYFIFA
jgi:hypothetical protein